MLDYKDITGLENIDALWLAKVEDSAAGLSEDEVLMLLKTPRSSLNEVEKVQFKLAHEIGRAKGKKLAIDRLFESMRDKGGQQASLAYLVRFADGWTEEGSGVAPGGNFVFSVTKSATPAKPAKVPKAQLEQPE